MTTMKNAGRTVTTTSKGCTKGMAKLTATDGNLTTEVIVPVKVARDHVAKLFSEGWR